MPLWLITSSRSTDCINEQDVGRECGSNYGTKVPDPVLFMMLGPPLFWIKLQTNIEINNLNTTKQ